MVFWLLRGTCWKCRPEYWANGFGCLLMCLWWFYLQDAPFLLPILYTFYHKCKYGDWHTSLLVLIFEKEHSMQLLRLSAQFFLNSGMLGLKHFCLAPYFGWENVYHTSTTLPPPQKTKQHTTRYVTSLIFLMLLGKDFLGWFPWPTAGPGGSLMIRNTLPETNSNFAPEN